MEKLLELISLCKCSVSVTINNHKDFNQSVEDYISDISLLSSETIAETIEGIGIDVYNTIIEKNTLIEVQAYPETPIGFYKVYHYDLETAIHVMLLTIKQ